MSKQIKLFEFEALLQGIKGATPITFVATTDARANKKSVEPDARTGEKIQNPYDKILKRTRVNGFIGYDYEAAVNRQRVRDGNTEVFEAQERSHGERIAPALAETNGVRKMVVKVQSYLAVEYFGVNGVVMKPITETEAKVFIREKTHSKSQDLDREVDHKEYNTVNIETANLLGESYEVIK